jgi:hypothetical protein
VRDIAHPIELTVPEILMESVRQLDELNELRDKLPALSARLVVPSPLVPPLRDLSEQELDVLQLAHNGGRFGVVLDRSRANDLETARIVLKLLETRYLVVQE